MKRKDGIQFTEWPHFIWSNQVNSFFAHVELCINQWSGSLCFLSEGLAIHTFKIQICTAQLGPFSKNLDPVGVGLRLWAFEVDFKTYEQMQSENQTVAKGKLRTNAIKYQTEENQKAE